MKFAFKFDIETAVLTLDEEQNEIPALTENKLYLAGEPFEAWPEFEENDRFVNFILPDDRVIRGVARNLFRVVE